MNWVAVLVASTVRCGLRYRPTQIPASFRVHRRAGPIRQDFYSLETPVCVRDPQKPERGPLSIPFASTKTEQAATPGCIAT